MLDFSGDWGILVGKEHISYVIFAVGAALVRFLASRV